VSLAETIGTFVGSTGQNLGKIFSALGAGHLVVLDEIDSVGSARGNTETSAGKEKNGTVNTMLTLLDRYRDGILVGTTNRRDLLDPALLRRFDAEVRFDGPTEESRRALSEKLCTKWGLDTFVPSEDEAPNFDAITKTILAKARARALAEIEAGEAIEKGAA
jgi:SpoVK/Ycf46/Vps4 family AAA+-type ATPase